MEEREGGIRFDLVVQIILFLYDVYIVAIHCRIFMAPALLTRGGGGSGKPSERASHPAPAPKHPNVLLGLLHFALRAFVLPPLVILWSFLFPSEVEA